MACSAVILASPWGPGTGLLVAAGGAVGRGGTRREGESPGRQAQEPSPETGSEALRT